tara:strand:+ start:553 stop:852 length:300 start_codon:yes stop_codon:yes gene_type:complete
MKESDRMRLLVCDCCDTMSRMGDRTMLASANGIQQHLEELLLNADEDRAEDLITSSLVVVLAILKPISEQMLASTDGRYTRSRIDVEFEPDEDLQIYPT